MLNPWSLFPAFLHSAPETAGGHFIAAAEALAVIANHLGRHVRIAIFIAIEYAGPAVVAEVLARALDAVVETAALPLGKGIRRSPVIHVVVARLPRSSAGQLRYGHFVAAHEALAVLIGKRRRNRRVAELRLVVGIGVAVELHVATRLIHAFAVAAALGIVIEAAHPPAGPVRSRGRRRRGDGGRGWAAP